jgi:cytochrome P450
MGASQQVETRYSPGQRAAVPAQPPGGGRLAFSDPRFQTDPWPMYAWYREHSPVHWSAESGAFFVFGAANVRKVLVSGDFQAFHPFRVSRRAFGPSMLDEDGERHRRWRAGATEPFRPRTVAGYGGTIVGPIVHAAMERMLRCARPDAVPTFAREVPMRVVCALMGLPEGDAEQLRTLMDPLVDYVDFAPVELTTVVEHREQLRAYFRDALADGRGDARGILHVLHSSEAYTEQDVVNNSLLLLAAGTATATAAILNLFARLAQDPALLDAVRADPGLGPAAVAETLRHEPPLHWTLRFAVRDVELDSVAIPQGAPMQVCVGSAGRDPALYQDPDRWDLRREQKAQLLFGAGEHSCLGMGLARLELETVLATAAQRIERVALADAEDGPARVQGRSFRAVDGSRLRVEPAAMTAIGDGA